MSQNNNEDFELDGFDYGTGSDDIQSGSDDFVDDDAFGLDLGVDEQVEPKVQERGQPRQQKVNLGKTSTQQKQQQRQKKPQVRNQDAPDYDYRRARQQQATQSHQETVQVVGGVDKRRVKSQQRVNPQRPQPTNTQVQQQPQQLPKQKRQCRMEQMIDEQVPMIENNQPVKKKSKLPFILIGLLLVVIVVVAVFVIQKTKLVLQEVDYSKSGKVAYDNLLTALNSYDATNVDLSVGETTGDSYLAQEWSYANNIEIRQDFIISVCANTSFAYPQVAQLSTKGKEMHDSDGNPIMITSPMNNNEAVTVTHIDYTALASTMEEDKEIILKMYKDSGISSEDYDYEEEMTDLMLDYIVSKGNLPTKKTDLTLGVSLGATPIISDDTELDKLLFSSDEFHSMCDTFSKVATGFTGYKTEKYTEKEEKANPEYTQWKMRFDAYYEADNGKFSKATSKWEPWYKRDENNNFILDENGEKIVNYYTVKDDQGNDWIQPSKTIMVDVEKERQVEVEWVNDSVIPYCFMGAYYCQNEYDGGYSPEVRIGDGTVEHPAGVGTPIITKCLGKDGKYHDVKVTLTGYWIGQDAIDYSISFSEKNRGFDINSVIQLICYEIKIENLEKKDFEFSSEMFLSDKSSNKSTRTGTMYGFYSDATVKAGESVVINDWATSTELEQKYVTWGSSFNRVYDTVYFRVLAGDGDVPTYSAYTAFTGESDVSGDDEDSDDAEKDESQDTEGTESTPNTTTE